MSTLLALFGGPLALRSGACHRGDAINARNTSPMLKPQFQFRLARMRRITEQGGTADFGVFSCDKKCQRR